MLESGKYSDLTMKSGSQRWAVHKAVVCAHSHFFDRACSAGFQARHVTTPPRPLSGPYSMSLSQPAATRFPLVWLHFNTRVYILADKYDIPDLKVEAWRNLPRLDEAEVRSPTDVAKLVETIVAVWAETPALAQRLRDYFLELVRAQAERLVGFEAFRRLLGDDGCEFVGNFVVWLARR